MMDLKISSGAPTVYLQENIRFYGEYDFGSAFIKNVFCVQVLRSSYARKTKGLLYNGRESNHQM